MEGNSLGSLNTHRIIPRNYSSLGLLVEKNRTDPLPHLFTLLAMFIRHTAL